MTQPMASGKPLILILLAGRVVALDLRMETNLGRQFATGTGAGQGNEPAPPAPSSSRNAIMSPVGATRRH